MPTREEVITLSKHSAGAVRGGWTLLSGPFVFTECASRKTATCVTFFIGSERRITRARLVGAGCTRFTNSPSLTRHCTRLDGDH
jgi:hypothetical protein